MIGQMGGRLRIALVAGEVSGDHLGGALLAALRRGGWQVEAYGVGGADMMAHGLSTFFPMADIAVMGPRAILRQLPQILRRIRETADRIVAAAPDALVIIDCPEFSHRVARRVRRQMPGLPVVDYVAPSVWAWRSGRARAMRAYVDEVMALLPFEPDVFERLGGPHCTYVGHPVAERAAPAPELIASLRAKIAPAGGPILAVMPGSRNNELGRLLAPFAEALAILEHGGLTPALVVPTLPHLRARIEAASADWVRPPTVLSDPADRHTAMHVADAAIVASGTATLELALARTPMVVGYRAEWLAGVLRPYFVKVPSIVLANLVHGGTPVAELFQDACTGARLAAEVGPLLSDSPQRRRQCAALDEIIAKVMGEGEAPSDRAAAIVAAAAQRAALQRPGR